jgi:hypothetical protein
MNVEIGTEAAQFPEKEYINGISVAVCFTAHMTALRPDETLNENVFVLCFFLRIFRVKTEAEEE